MIDKDQAQPMTTTSFDREVEERLVRYASIDTQSDDAAKTSPSSAIQFDLLNLLVGELKEIGAQDVTLTDYGAVLATIPATVEGAETASDAHVALVWRVAQEAVRNAMRHSDASTLAVTVRGDGRTLALEVVDDGTGFDPARTAPDSCGLRGLRSLVADSGGVLEVRSSPGEGTTVRMEVNAQ